MLNPEIIISFASLLVALCALLFTWYQVRLSREHNRLSVKPHITTFSYSKTIGTDAYLIVELMNNGLGPAIIINFKILFDGDLVSLNDQKKTTEHIKEHFQQPQDYLVAQLGPGYVMPANETRSMIQLKFPNASGLQDDYEALLDRYDVVIEYKNMYNDVLPTYTTEDHKSLSTSAPNK